jgi:polysaccharide export outer membrane protein
MRHKIIFLALAVLSACTPGGDLPPLPPAASMSYRLGTGDRLRIITYGEDQLTGDFSVNDSGNIEVPLLGPVHASGLTVTGLQAAIVEALRAHKLLNKPSVSVEVSTFRPIFVLGEVNKPGAYPYQPDMTVLTAVAVAGGFTYRAAKDTEGVTRVEDNGASVQGRAAPATVIEPGDVVTVFERNF